VPRYRLTKDCGFGLSVSFTAQSRGAARHANRTALSLVPRGRPPSQDFPPQRSIQGTRNFHSKCLDFESAEVPSQIPAARRPRAIATWSDCSGLRNCPSTRCRAECRSGVRSRERWRSSLRLAYLLCSSCEVGGRPSQKFTYVLAAAAAARVGDGDRVGWRGWRRESPASSQHSGQADCDRLEMRKHCAEKKVEKKQERAGDQDPKSPFHLVTSRRATTAIWGKLECVLRLIARSPLAMLSSDFGIFIPRQLFVLPGCQEKGRPERQPI
jgi:hypothetical protein